MFNLIAAIELYFILNELNLIDTPKTEEVLSTFC